jgi:hypothetical protein
MAAAFAPARANSYAVRRHRSTGDPGFGNDESTDGGTRVSRYGLRNLVLRTACAAGP